MNLPPRALVIAGAAIVLLSGGTAVLAATTSTPVGPGGVIHGCHTTAGTNGSHTLVLQDTGTSCRAGDTAIKWNKQGPQGPAEPTGPQGPIGPQGPAGPQGPSGPSTAGSGGLGVTMVSSSVTDINSDNTLSAGATARPRPRT